MNFVCIGCLLSFSLSSTGNSESQFHSMLDARELSGYLMSTLSNDVLISAIQFMDKKADLNMEVNTDSLLRTHIRMLEEILLHKGGDLI